MLVLVFVLSALASVVIGMACKRADLGFATMATIAAWVACFEGAMLFSRPRDTDDRQISNP